MTAIGSPLDRRDGRLKVTGQAKYTSEIELPDIAHAVLVESAIARGRIEAIDVSKAMAAPGVINVLTHLNFPRLASARPMLDPGNDSQLNASGAGQQRLPMQDQDIDYAGEHLAVVIAEKFEEASEAASLVRVTYGRKEPIAGLETYLEKAFSPGKEWASSAEVSRGNLAEGLANAEARVDAIYHTAIQHHNTMEPHATLAFWQGSKLTVYEPSTWVYGVRKTLGIWLGIPEENIRVIQQFVGGSFGCKGPTWPHVVLAAVAAREVKTAGAAGLEPASDVYLGRVPA